MSAKSIVLLLVGLILGGAFALYGSDYFEVPGISEDYQFLYEGLKGDYDALNYEYQSLLSDYNELSTEFKAIQRSYEELSIGYELLTRIGRRVRT